MWAATGISDSANRVLEDLARQLGRNYKLWENAFAYECRGDGSTDDTANLQRAIDRIAATTGVPAICVRLGEGTFRITGQLNFHQKAVCFLGAGIGNPSSFTASPGQGTTLVWDGAAGGTMINVQDAKHVVIAHMLILGNESAKPSELIYFQSEGGSVGTNEQLFLEHLQVGGFRWTDPSTSGSVADRGIRFGGSQNGNNDQFHFRDVVVEGCDRGLAIDNTQSIWGQLTNVEFNRCAVAGVETSSSLHFTNATFNECAVDWLINSTAHVQGEGYYAENSSQWVQLTGQGYFGATVGILTNNATIAGTNGIDHQSCGDAGGLWLAQIFFNQAGLAHPKVKVRGTNGAPRTGSVTILDCPGLASTDFDIANVISGANIYVFMASRENFTHQVLGPSGDVLSDTTVFAAEFSVDDLTVNDALHIGTDITLTNPATDILAMGEAFYIQRAAAAVAYLAYVTGDTTGRWYVDSNGKMFFSSGSAGADVTLERSAANVLSLGANDALRLSGFAHGSLPSPAGYAAPAQLYCNTHLIPVYSDGAAHWVDAAGANHT